ncbi:MAG TPA: hypothetical protein VL996_13060 [Methylocella sp.]|nr:hypothetical protein [Methylocella sp.]
MCFFASNLVAFRVFIIVLLPKQLAKGDTLLERSTRALQNYSNYTTAFALFHRANFGNELIIHKAILAAARVNQIASPRYMAQLNNH